MIYFVLDATREYQRVKIGTTTDLRARLVALRKQTATGQEPLVLALAFGGRPEERALHERFAGARMMGEWFDYQVLDLYQYVASLPNPLGWLLDHPEVWREARGWAMVPDLPSVNWYEPPAPSEPIHF